MDEKLTSEDEDFFGVEFSSGEVGTEIIGKEVEVDEIAWPTLLFDEFLEEAMGLAALLHEILGILELWAENPL